MSKHNRTRRAAGAERASMHDNLHKYCADGLLPGMVKARAESTEKNLQAKLFRYPTAPEYHTHVGTHTGPKDTKVVFLRQSRGFGKTCCPLFHPVNLPRLTFVG